MTSARKIKAAVDVTSAKILDHQPPFIRRGKVAGKFALGVRYEKQVHEYLVEASLGRPELRYIPSPWIEFEDASGRRWCQPDAVVICERSGIGIIYEAKHSHCAEAWFQLVQLYEPVLRVVFPAIRFGLIEVCHWHDPAVRFPQQYDFTPDIFSARHAGRVSVHIYNPKRERFRPTGYRNGESGGEKAGAVWHEEGAK